MFTLAHASIVSLAVQAPDLARQRQAPDLARKFHKDFNPLDLDKHLRTGQPDITETALLKMCTFFQETDIHKRFCFKAKRSCAPSVSDKDFDKIWCRSTRRRSKSATENPEIKTTGTDEMFTLADACAVYRAVQAPELESQAHDLARKFHNEFNPLDHIHLRSDQPDLPKAALLKMCALFQEEGIDKHVCFTAMKSCAPSASEKDLHNIWRAPQDRSSLRIRRSPVKVKENAADLHGAGPMQMQIQGAVPLMAEASVLPFVDVPVPPALPAPLLLDNTSIIPTAVGGGLLLYLVGSQAEDVFCLPLRNVSEKEFNGGKGDMRVYQGYRATMKRYYKKALQMNLLPKDLDGIDISLADVKEIVNQVLPALGVAARTDTGKVRTLPLMAWSSAENERRKNSRVTQE
jgi:hypothetical protein